MERREAKVSSGFHIRFGNDYYSADKAFKHQKVSVHATNSVVKVYARNGKYICEHPRTARKVQGYVNPNHLLKNQNPLSKRQ